MFKGLTAGFITLIAIGALVACGGMRNSAGTSQMQSVNLPPLDDNLAITELVGKDTIGVAYPGDIGHVFSKVWKATVAGYTQSRHSQILMFRAGTKIKITNISKGIPHTLNVLAKRTGPPARFPSNPKLLFSKNGGNMLDVDFRSGTIQPGHSITVTLVKGIYLIGCAYHYKTAGMRDVLIVK